jgi:hypothetical protein
MQRRAVTPKKSATGPGPVVIEPHAMHCRTATCQSRLMFQGKGYFGSKESGSCDEFISWDDLLK